MYFFTKQSNHLRRTNCSVKYVQLIVSISIRSN